MSYKVKYCCSNCLKDFEQSFPHGTEAPTKIVCPLCGCYSAVKKWK